MCTGDWWAEAGSTITIFRGIIGGNVPIAVSLPSLSKKGVSGRDIPGAKRKFIDTEGGKRA